MPLSKAGGKRHMVSTEVFTRDISTCDLRAEKAPKPKNAGKRAEVSPLKRKVSGEKPEVSPGSGTCQSRSPGTVGRDSNVRE